MYYLHPRLDHRKATNKKYMYWPRNCIIYVAYSMLPETEV